MKRGKRLRFGEKIQQLMAQRNWAPEALAMKAGISRATVYSLLASKWHFEFSDRTVDRVATAFRLPVHILTRDIHGRPMSAYDKKNAENYPELPANYAPAPEYKATEEDLAIAGKAESAEKGVKPGIAGLSDVMTWFKSLQRDDRVAVFAMISRYVDGEKKK
ncbi:MAG TPA: helix-turn-helix transcriptional regulator [Phycisphaerae bacterium]|nr:helix-turn-helix transcriptional regulator [Phycisphaerae bacterium]